MELRIINYEEKYQPYFEGLNKAWLNEFFVVEPIDEYVLGKPKEAILDHGGTILFAASGDDILGTVALKTVEPGVLEMTKMAVDSNYRGIGAGRLLCEAAIDAAKNQHAKSLILYSSTRLAPAINMYRKMGFSEIPLQKGLYGRADIMMELKLN